MAMVEKLGGNWAIVRVEGGGASDEADNRDSWTGDGWAAQYGSAKQFVTREEAEAYLTEHGHELAAGNGTVPFASATADRSSLLRWFNG